MVRIALLEAVRSKARLGAGAHILLVRVEDMAEGEGLAQILFNLHSTQDLNQDRPESSFRGIQLQKVSVLMSITKLFTATRFLTVKLNNFSRKFDYVQITSLETYVGFMLSFPSWT